MSYVKTSRWGQKPLCISTTKINKSILNKNQSNLEIDLNELCL